MASPGAALRANTGPLPPPPKRPTESIPPPPLRPPTGALPQPRASGKLPELPPEAAALPDSLDTEAPAHDFSTPAGRPSLPLPDYKPLFDYDDPTPTPAKPAAAKDDAVSPGWPEPEAAAPAEEETFAPAPVPAESSDVAPKNEGTGDLAAQVQELEEKLSLATEQRDQARAELDILQKKGGKSADAALAELEEVGRERDEAKLEVIVLRSQLEAAEQNQRDTRAMASQLEELSHVIDERDSVRRDYATLREQFETLKLDRSRGDATEEIQRLEEENRQLHEQLTKAAAAKGGATDAPVSADVAELREELKKAKEEASLAARGLALSQKALQDTREALKAASEGSSSPKGSQEEWKKERATLVRQNMLLQGQNEQLTRDLSALKAKLGAQDS